MIVTVKNEAPFQILSSSFSIGPSETGYDLQVGADSRNFTTLFSVGANTPRMVTNVANGSYFRLKNNVGDVKVNWQRVCTDEGGGGASGTELSPVSEFPAGAEAGTVIAYSGSSSAAGIYQFDGTDWVEAGGSADLSGYYTSAQTEDAISAATSGKADAANLSIGDTNPGDLWFPEWNEQGIITGKTGSRNFQIRFDVNGIQNRVTSPDSGYIPSIWAATNAGTAGDILVSTGNGAPVWSAVTMGGNSNILAAITTQAEYEAISGDVKTGDLIEVQGVVLDGYDEPQYGLFGAVVDEEEYEGVVRKLISWARRDNMNSVTWSGEDYPWMPQNNVQPIELPGNGFLISPDMTAEDEAYNGIGFDGDGKPVITHFAPEYDDETGEVTGITRTDTPIGGGADMSAYTPTSGFSTINGSAITNGGNITVAVPDMSDYWNSAETKTYVDNRIDGYEEESTITITSTRDAENLDVYVAAMGWMGPNYYLYLTDADVEVATLDNAEMRQDGSPTYVPGVSDMYGDYRYCFDTSAVLTEAMLGQKFSLSQGAEGRIELNETNFPVSYPQYFVLDKANMEGWFTNTLSTSVYVPGVVKSDGVITKVQKLTQAEYDAIPTKDPSTFYIIL